MVEQCDSTKIALARELAPILRRLDSTRLFASDSDNPGPRNYLIRSSALDLVGFNCHHFLFEAFPQTFPGKGSSPGGQLAAGHLQPLPYAFGLHWRVCQLRSEIEAKWQSRPGLFVLREMPRSVCSTHEATWQIIRKHPCSLASLSARAFTTWANLLAIGGRRGAAIPCQSIWPAFRKMPTTTRLSGGSGQSPRMPPLELVVG